jgi:hypothetical protein
VYNKINDTQLAQTRSGLNIIKKLPASFLMDTGLNVEIDTVTFQIPACDDDAWETTFHTEINTKTRLRYHVVRLTLQRLIDA